ncbi:MAG: hypothetical protein WD963_00175 [Candidatus Paceibacterota bacterium]
MLPENIIYLGIVFYIIGYYVYFRDMIFGQTRPNLVTWFIWMLAPFIGVFFQLKAGAGLSVLPVFLAGLGPLVVLVVSICKKNGYWKITTFDIACGIFALISLLLYIVTHNLAISILFAILADALAFLPTFKKSWSNPESESGLLYISTTMVNILGVLIIKDWIFTIYSFGLYLIVFNIIEVTIIYRKKIFKS